MSGKTGLVTGASRGFGRLTAEALARAGDVICASMRDIGGRNAANAAAMAETARAGGIFLRPLESDVQPAPLVKAAVALIAAESARVAVVIHNAAGAGSHPRQRQS